MIGLRVLVAEDNPEEANLLGTLLGMQGHEVVGWAANGMEAVRLTRDSRPDVVLMDVRMPDMDGIEATRRISEEKLAAVVILTAFEDEELVAEATGAGAAAYLTKPVQQKLMARALAMAAARFRESREDCLHLSALVDAAPVGIILAEADGHIALANSEAERLLGRPRGDLVLLPTPDLGLFRPSGEPYPPAEFPLTCALWHGETCRGEEVIVHHPDGTTVHLLINAAPITDSQGHIIAAMATFQDITPLRDLERHREEFISTVAHDLRLPVTIITGFASMLERLGPNEHATEMERRALDHILTSARRLTKMISDLLDVSSLESHRLALDKQPTDLPKLVQGVRQRMAEVMAGHPVRVVDRGPVPPVEIDVGRIEQVLINLLSNAAKYSYLNTEVVVEIEARPAERPQEVIVSVTNQGRGIAPEDAPGLFTRFYRSRTARQEKTPGLGLGLYIARGLVEAHGGRLWVESEVDRYATFRFTLKRG